MNNLMTVNWNREAMEFPGRKEIILSGACRGLLPVNMVSEGENLRGVYNLCGFLRLSQLGEQGAWEILNIAEKTLECLEICKDFLLFPDEYVLSPETIFIKEDFNDVRLAYIPAAKRYGENTAITSYISELKKKTTDNGRIYLDTIGKMLECRNLNLYRVISFIQELKHEIKTYEIV